MYIMTDWSVTIIIVFISENPKSLLILFTARNVDSDMSSMSASAYRLGPLSDIRKVFFTVSGGGFVDHFFYFLSV